MAHLSEVPEDKTPTAAPNDNKQSTATPSTSSCCEAQQESGQCGSATHVDDGYECSVCADILLEPVVAPCGHDFCQACYEKWCQTSCSNGVMVVCPLCRAPLPLQLGVCVRLKRTVESLYPAATKQRRLEQESSIAEPGNPRKKPCYAHCSAAANTGGYGLPPHVLPAAAGWGMAMVPPGMPPQSVHAYHMGMMAMYMQYQQAWMSQAHIWPASQTQPRSQEATGTPVADVVFSHQRHLASLSQPLPQQAPVQQPPAPAPAPTPASQQQWQSVADVPLRLACARSILAVLRARVPRACGPQGTSPGALAIVRAVEVHLYRTAPSRAAYTDALTLDDRVVEFVRTRVRSMAGAAQASSREGSVAGAHPAAPTAVPGMQEVEQPTSPSSGVAAVF